MKTPIPFLYEINLCFGVLDFSNLLIVVLIPIDDVEITVPSFTHPVPILLQNPIARDITSHLNRHKIMYRHALILPSACSDYKHIT